METGNHYENREVPQHQTEFQARLHEKEVRADLTDDELGSVPQEKK